MKKDLEPFLIRDWWDVRLLMAITGKTSPDQLEGMKVQIPIKPFSLRKGSR